MRHLTCKSVASARMGTVFSGGLGNINRAKSVSLRTKFVRVVSHVCGTAFALERELAEFGKSDECQEWMGKQEEKLRDKLSAT